MEKLLFLVALAMFSMSPVNMSLAAKNPAGTGQPGTPTVSCGIGNAVNQPKGFLTATHYAGSPGTPSAEHINSPRAVSQYDIACYEQTQNH